MRPKECIFAGACGTHSICVCKIHENTKLLIAGANITELVADDENISFLKTYKTMLSSMVCDTKTLSCFLGCCKSCPGVSPLIEKLDRLFENNCITKISYNSWTSTDRTSLDTFCNTTEKYLKNSNLI